MTYPGALCKISPSIRLSRVLADYRHILQVKSSKRTTLTKIRTFSLSQELSVCQGVFKQSNANTKVTKYVRCITSFNLNGPKIANGERRLELPLLKLHM